MHQPDSVPITCTSENINRHRVLSIPCRSKGKVIRVTTEFQLEIFIRNIKKKYEAEFKEALNLTRLNVDNLRKLA